MTEAEWLACNDPAPMLEFLRDKASDRKLRLFGCACCRRQLDAIPPNDEFRRAVGTADDYADGLADDAALAADYEAARIVAESPSPVVGWDNLGAMELVDWSLATISVALCAPALGVTEAANVAAGAAELWTGTVGSERRFQAALLRDIFGNPFRPVNPDPSWRTSTALTIAEGIYADRAFDRLPILADALEDAGCDKGELLAHLRDDGPHVRGCWALDLVLGKE